MKRTIFLILFLFILSFKCGTIYGIRIVVLGSSTAAGWGPKDWNNAWVNQYRKYLQTIDHSSEVINLAVGGYTTYDVMPTDYVPPLNRPAPDTKHNITEALNYKPDAIIINLPSNDIGRNFSVEEILDNYKQILNKAALQKVPVWVTTPQPVNSNSPIFLQKRIALRDSTYKLLGNKVIDFWTDIANSDGSINSLYSAGDGIHLNDSAHTILKNRVVSMNIPDSIYENEIKNCLHCFPDTSKQILNVKVSPNPFKNQVVINYFLTDSGKALIKVYNIKGQVESILVDKFESSGNHSAIWHGVNNIGVRLNSGIYICSIKLISKTGRVYITTQKIVEE